MDGNYIALAVTLVVWIGIFFYLRRLDKRLKEIEKRR
jgi:CcmD family protein